MKSMADLYAWHEARANVKLTAAKAATEHAVKHPSLRVHYLHRAQKYKHDAKPHLEAMEILK